ncbi:glucuronoxylan 4-O-methyltransferase 1 [Setaria italica]|nr:glucuronoxylan 4-O-methyltransferase 1 [Setaria italica]
MGAIYAAGMAARARRPGATTDVLVHDVDRPVEDRFSRAFLCEAYMVEQVGELRHFAVPSHRGRDAVPSHRGRDAVPPFCPHDEDTANA